MSKCWSSARIHESFLQCILSGTKELVCNGTYLCPNNAKLKFTSVALGAKHLMKNMYNE
jgi:hypothetical protein